jgi:hypothetical protein
MSEAYGPNDGRVSEPSSQVALISPADNETKESTQAELPYRLYKRRFAGMLGFVSG